MSASFSLNFDEYEKIQAPDNEFMWQGLIDIKQGRFAGQQTINIFTKDQVVSDGSKEFIESILTDIEILLLEGLAYVKARFKEDPAVYKILDHELAWLDLSLDEFPLYEPDLTFYCESDEWNVRFAEGKFGNCEPYGVLVSFIGITPTRADDPADFEDITEE
ncbi:hypothetical protein [Niastella sp. OAS944]|uniref:hypothetical protein n=1 Tax=Niastella sp. OAS944 TaxID=2664089 RepID=UPI00349848A4|nr:hypothetical protein [Chitinophagaceae bacterium OAS944]